MSRLRHLFFNSFYLSVSVFLSFFPSFFSLVPSHPLISLFCLSHFVIIRHSSFFPFFLTFFHSSFLSFHLSFFLSFFLVFFLPARSAPSPHPFLPAVDSIPISWWWLWWWCSSFLIVCCWAGRWVGDACAHGGRKAKLTGRATDDASDAP